MTLDDIDNDGLLELYVAHGRNEPGRLFTYDGEQFAPLADNNGIEPFKLDRAGYFVDLDADGWKDFVSVQIQSVEVFMNDQTGHFNKATSSTNIFHDRSTFSLAAADYDVDGDIDLFFGHWGANWRLKDPLAQYLWQNDGSGFFTDVTDQVAISDEETLRGVAAETSFTPTFADIDSDGYPDMLLASDFARSQVLRNESGQAFVDATTTVISDENGMGNAVGDYDRDGDLDWFVSSINDGDDSDEGGTGNRLYRNVDGLGNFEDVTDEAGVPDGYWAGAAVLQISTTTAIWTCFTPMAWKTLMTGTVTTHLDCLCPMEMGLLQNNPNLPGSLTRVRDEALPVSTITMTVNWIYSSPTTVRDPPSTKMNQTMPITT